MPLLGAALGVALLVPAPALGAPGDPACASDKTLVLTLKTRERGFSAPLVTKHEQGISAEWSGDVGRTSLAVPAGVEVLKQGPARLLLNVPLGASLAVTASWEQAIDPSDPLADPTDPAMRCNATQTVALPILAPRPSRAFYRLMSQEDIGGFAAFAVATDPTAADLSRVTILVRTTSSARFPSPRSRARRMPVPMTTGELKRYGRKLPGPNFSPSPVMCRFYWLCNRVATVQVAALGERRPGGRITKSDLKRLGPKLARTQPFKRAAPFGVRILANPGQAQPPALGYDIQVRQAGRLVARVRRAVRCRKDPQFFNNLVCRTVKKKNG